MGQIGSQLPQRPEVHQGQRGNIVPTGPQGDTGPTGDVVHQGDVGPQGDTGPQGAQGPQGDMGHMGPQGDTGPQGPQGQTQKSILYNPNYSITEKLTTCVFIPFNAIKYTLNSVLLSLNLENNTIVQLISPLGIMASIELPKSGQITLELDSFTNVPTSTCTLQLQCQSLPEPLPEPLSTENIEITSTVIAIELEMNIKN